MVELTFALAGPSKCQIGTNNNEKKHAVMVEILNLALPYFGLIFIGFACGKAKKLPAGHRRIDGVTAAGAECVCHRPAYDTWIEPASVAVLIGTFASVVTPTSAVWFIQSGRLVFP